MKRNQKIAAIGTSLLAAFTLLWAHGQDGAPGPEPYAAGLPPHGPSAHTAPVGGVLVAWRPDRR